MDFWDVVGDPALRLELVQLTHADALERFERDNRAFFAASVSDRGDDYFEQFAQRLAGVVEENESGRSLCFVAVGPDGAYLARVNLYDLDQPGGPELGFRVAENVLGRGVATRAVSAALDVARIRGVVSVVARASTTNLASQRVLERCGFSSTGPTEAPVGTSTSFVGFRRQLV